MDTDRRIAILISGGGSNMSALVEALQAPGFPAKPCLVLSNRPDAGGLKRAETFGVPTSTVDHTRFEDRESFEAAIERELMSAKADFICLARFMRILTDAFTKRWAGRMLNIHPSLLPAFKGLDTHARALAAGVAVHGATVHQVSGELDSGAILGQAVVRVEKDDTETTLAARVLRQEHRLYSLVLKRFLDGETSPIALID